MATMTYERYGAFVLYSDHEAAIKVAVAAEREACAKVCESEFVDDYKQAGLFLAKQIRARGAAHD